MGFEMRVLRKQEANVGGGDRMRSTDGKRVKDEVPMYYLIPHFLTKRYDAMNMVTVDIPVKPLRAIHEY